MTMIYRGLPASPGIGIGQLFVYRPGYSVPMATGTVDPEQEWEAFLHARDRVDTELAQQANSANSVVAELFAAHRIILQDSTLISTIRTAIFSQGETAIQATQGAIEAQVELFRGLEDDYFAARAADILDLGQRLLSHLGATTGASQLATIPAGAILIAEDLSPSDLAQLSPSAVTGIALAHSTPTAHSAILARSMGIPMICTVGIPMLDSPAGLTTIVDGNRGQILIEPDEEQLEQYTRLRAALHVELETARAYAHEPAVTADGVHVPILANANSPEEVALAGAMGADGIGLLRTEYLFRNRATPPTQQEQADTYRLFVSQIHGQLTIRALDAGGDKPVAYILHQEEDNPFLGLRGIRLLIEQPDLLCTQYKALCAARPDSDSDVELRFMLPMISTTEEVLAVRELLSTISVSGPTLKLGVMIEVPSAALIAPAISDLVDFFSIGTNDLAQYVLATDRTNSTVAHLADPLHPAVLHLIKATCDAAHAAGKPVSLCGEVGGDPVAVPLLLGLGVTELSVPLPAVPLVKQTVRRCRIDECRQLAQQSLRCGTAAAVRALLSP